MKKSILFVAALLASNLALAQFKGPGLEPGGGADPVMVVNHPLLTVSAIQEQGRDDMRVTVEGNILRHHGGDRYIFSDGTGELIVEIDDEIFPRNVPVTPENRVRLSGKLDVDRGKPTELDVKRLQILP